VVGPEINSVGLCRRILGQVRSERPSLAVIFLLELFGTPLSLLAPVGVKIAIDNVIGDQPLSSFLKRVIPAGIQQSPKQLLIAAAALQVFVVLLIQLHTFCSYILKTKTGERLVLDFRAALFRHLQRLPLAYHDTCGTPDSTFRVQDEAPAIKSVTIDGALFLLSDIVKLVAMSFVTLFIDWRLALSALSVAPVLVIFSVIYQKRVGGRYKQVRKIESSALKIIQEVLSSIRVVKAFGQEDAEEDRFVSRSKEGQKARVKLAFADAAFGLAVNMATAAGMAIVLFVGTRNVQNGVLTLGSLLMVITYLVQLYTPLQNITYHVASLQSSTASVDRSFEVFMQRPEAGTDSRNRSVDCPSIRVAGAVEFNKVSFAYGPDRPVLQDLCLSISPGTKVGLVGRTGSGKTTFVNMLVRFHDPVSGQIRLDGVDLRDYPLDMLRQQFAFVLQEPALFSTSIAANIAYGRPDATREQIVEAAIAANAHDFIMSLPRGYETEVGERGGLVSGGERQRISLARAFLKDAPILILDEPTSALDGKTEADILKTMGRLMMGRTTFFISHRLGALSNCDVILKLDHTNAVEMPAPRSISEIEAFVFGVREEAQEQTELV
jgi:ATP-binding cassette, subfamily B, bacterial